MAERPSKLAEPRTRPYPAIRWDGSTPYVLLDETWYELRAIDDVSWYTPQLERSLQSFLRLYNHDRAHRGYRTRGRTPASIVLGANER